MHTTLRIVPVFLFLAVAAAACGDGDPVTEEERQARREARLAACISEEIQIKARNDLTSLEQMVGEPADDAPGAVRAPYVFLRAYVLYADLRAHETAYLDSAYHAATQRDSIRYHQTASTYRVNPPSARTVEANVVERYRREFSAALVNPRHPCRLEMEAAEVRR